MLEEICLFKPVSNNLNKLNHSSPMNNTVTNKIKHFTQLFTLDPQIPLKRKWHDFSLRSTGCIKSMIFTWVYYSLPIWL